jgi:hypothetical protein
MDILSEREPTHGRFQESAELAQNLKYRMAEAPNWGILLSDQRQALEMIATKISRILCGDRNLVDSWEDIAGYAILVADRLRDDNKNKD